MKVTKGLFLHYAGHVALVFALFDRLAFVVFLFASSYADDEFGESAVIDEEPQGHDGETGLFARLLDLVDFLA